MSLDQQGKASRQTILGGVALGAIVSLAVMVLVLGGNRSPQGEASGTTTKPRVLGVTVTRASMPKPAVPAGKPSSATTTTTAIPLAPTSTATATPRSSRSSSSARGATTATTIVTTNGTVITYEAVPTTAAPLPPAGRANERADNTVAFTTRPPTNGAEIGTALTAERQDPNWFGFAIDAPRRDNGEVLTAVISNTNEETLSFPGGLAITFNITGSNGVVQTYTVRQPAITHLDAYTQLKVEQFLTLAGDDYTMNATTIVDYP